MGHRKIDILLIGLALVHGESFLVGIVKADPAINLRHGTGTFSVDWFDVNKNNSVPGKSVEGGSVRTVTTRFGGPAVLYLKRQ